MNNGRLVYTIRETAQLLGINRNTAYMLANEHQLPAIRIGKKRFIVPKIQLDALLENGTTPNRELNYVTGGLRWAVWD